MRQPLETRAVKIPLGVRTKGLSFEPIDPKPVYEHCALMHAVADTRTEGSCTPSNAGMPAREAGGAGPAAATVSSKGSELLVLADAGDGVLAKTIKTMGTTPVLVRGHPSAAVRGLTRRTLHSPCRTSAR